MLISFPSDKMIEHKVTSPQPKKKNRGKKLFILVIVNLLELVS